MKETLFLLIGVFWMFKVWQFQFAHPGRNMAFMMVHMVKQTLSRKRFRIFPSNSSWTSFWRRDAPVTGWGSKARGMQRRSDSVVLNGLRSDELHDWCVFWFFLYQNKHPPMRLWDWDLTLYYNSFFLVGMWQVGDVIWCYLMLFATPDICMHVYHSLANL